MSRSQFREWPRAYGVDGSPIAQNAALWLSQCYDLSDGARPLKRVIQQNIQDELAREILTKRIGDGQTITEDVKDRKVALIAT